MANSKYLSAVICYAILLSAYHEVSATCTNCSMYFEFAHLKPVVEKIADFNLLAITDQLTNCRIDYGDTESEVKSVAPGLTYQIVRHIYQDAGTYDVTCECQNAKQFLSIAAKTSSTSTLKLNVEYNVKTSLVELKLEVESSVCLDTVNCDIYFEKQKLDSVTVKKLLTGYSKKPPESGFYHVGVTCPCSPDTLYMEETIRVYEECLEEYFFHSFPQTSEQDPFVIYEDNYLVFDKLSQPSLCGSAITSRQWIIKKKVGAIFEPVNWTLPDTAAFPENTPFGLYSIGLNVSTEKTSHIDTLYLLYKKIVRPLKIYGGSLQFTDSSQTVSLFEDEHQEGVYYLWCYHKHATALNITKPLFNFNLQNNVNCEQFTKNNSFQIPTNYNDPWLFVQVFAITETYFTEGRSVLALIPMQQRNQIPVNIRCIYNCDGQVSAKVNWVLYSEIDANYTQENSSVTYQWGVGTFESNEYKVFIGQGNWSEGADTPTLTVIGGSLPTNTWVKVCVNIKIDSLSGSSCIEAFSGSPPSNGMCAISSLYGVATVTNFTINCTGYSDDGMKAFRPYKIPYPPYAGIRYVVLFVSDENVVVIYYGVLPETGPFHLGAGDSGTNNAVLYIRVYDMYYSFENITVDMTVELPSVMSGSSEDIEKYLLGRISNIEHLPRQDQYNFLNSVSGVINKMKTQGLMQNIEYNVKDMTRGKFIDFDLDNNVFKTWEDMVLLLKNEDNIEKIILYSKIIADCVIKLNELVQHDDHSIGLLATLGTLNLAVSYHPYVSNVTMDQGMNSSAYLLRRALELCEKPIISVFMTDITDCSEIMLGRLMSIINTEQILLASEGFEWDTVRKYMEADQRYVKLRIIDTAMVESEIDEFERFYILQKTYLRSNIRINRKRDQAKILSNNIVDVHLHYMKELIDTISATGRTSKAKTGTFICAKKTAETKNLDGIGCGDLNIQTDADNSSQAENVANIQALTTKEKLFTYDKDRRSSLISQPTMIVKMGNDSTNRSFLVKFGNLSQTPLPETPKFIDGDQARLFYHRFLYRTKTDFACIRLTPGNSTMAVLGYETYFNLLSPPHNDSFDYRTAFSHENLTNGYYQFCVPPGVFKNNGSLFVAFRPFFPSGVTGDASDLLAPYSFEAVSANCLMWNASIWSEESCRLLWTDHVACECFSNEQVTVSNTFFVPPNVIDFSSVFNKFDIINNSTVFSVVLGLFLLFIIILVIALRQDRKDEHMGHFRSLSDNYKEDNFYYLLIVYTGLKVGAGTQSNICFLLSGEHATSGVRSLSDESHKGFKSGSVRKFLMTTPGNLGDLIFLKIWTDGSGTGEESSWFLDRFEVMEVNSERKFIFRCDAWLTTDESGRPVYIIPCNRFQDEFTFSCRFKENMYESVTDGHLWFSSYVRPCYGQFTRAQRVTCCTLVLYMTMIINAMFYRTEENLLKPNQFTLGPLRFSVSQIAISLQSIAITLPPTFLVLFLFKNSKPPKYKYLSSLKKVDKQDMEENTILTSTPEEFPGNGILPHFCVYVGWFISFLAIMASGFFVILYSMQWGKTKSQEWMTTFLLSSGESLFFVDPMKIFLAAFIVAFLGKGKRKLKLTYFDNMSILHEIYYILYKKKDKPVKFTIFPPMGRREKIKRQREVQREIWLKSILLNFVMYALLLWSSSSLAFTNRNTNAFVLKDHVQKTFADPPGSAITFSGITTVTSFYKWARNIVYPSLYPTTDYKGSRLFWIDKKFINDGVNMKIGPMRLRQLRIETPENCSTYHLVGILDCYPPYSISREEKASYCIGWEKKPNCGYQMAYNETLTAWSYTRSNQINGLPIVGVYNTYGGGGYIMNYYVNYYVSNKIQDEFKRALWIDRKTRAVFLEFTLYNANTNQFANVFFLVEFPETGGAIPYYQINVITAYNIFDPYTVASLVVFGICFIMFIIKNSYNLIRQRAQFFKNFWNLVDLSAFITTSSMSVAYALQYYGTQAVMDQFRLDPRIFVNFYYLVVLNQLITYNLAFQIFFTVIRVSCILGVSQRMSELAAVMKQCIADLIGVFYIFSIYVLAFTVVGNICFATTHTYRSYGSSLMAIILLLVGRTNFTELVAISPVIGKIFFIAKIFFMIFIILKMFEGVLSVGISSKKRMKVQLSLLELFMKHLKVSRLVHLSNSRKRKNQKVKTSDKENKF